jgi:Rod binding domain-containing protein
MTRIWDTGSGGALGEFASEALGQALSERGGFGIADRIVKELSHPVTSSKREGNQKSARQYRDENSFND